MAGAASCSVCRQPITSSGAPMVTDDCNTGYWSEMFAIQALGTI
jgi:hypothetical protein